MTQAYPLQWPDGWPRTPSNKRKEARFGTRGRAGYLQSLTIAEAIERLQRQLDHLNVRFPVISSNLEMRLDGLPRSGQREPDDVGVAVYFELKGVPHCMPCDRWNRAADNIAAIAGHIEAMRAIERYGVIDVTKAFEGFARLPQPKSWRDILDNPSCLENAEKSYRTKAKDAHPDLGGSVAMMAELNAAIEQARRELR